MDGKCRLRVRGDEDERGVAHRGGQRGDDRPEGDAPADVEGHESNLHTAARGDCEQRADERAEA